MKTISTSEMSGIGGGACKLITTGVCIEGVQLEDGDPALLACPFCEAPAQVKLLTGACYIVTCSQLGCGARIAGMHAANIAKDGRLIFGGSPHPNYRPEAHIAAALDAIARWNKRVAAFTETNLLPSADAPADRHPASELIERALAWESDMGSRRTGGLIKELADYIAANREANEQRGRAMVAESERDRLALEVENLRSELKSLHEDHAELIADLEHANEQIALGSGAR